MYIYQPDRALLKEQIKKASSFVRGKTLDVGAGEVNRYGKMFQTETYTKMDVHAGPNVDIVGTAEKIPFPNDSLDSVICTQVFEHLAHPVKSAEEIFRVLKKGGHLIVTVPQMNELHEEPYDFFRYTNFGLDVLFKDAGFTIVHSEQRGGYFTLMAQMVTRYLMDKFHLFKRPFLGRVMSKLFHALSSVAYFLDRVDTSKANRKHTIGWCIVCRK
jgi:SAM-dependent methyltransferase